MKPLLKRGIEAKETSGVIGRGERVVLEYVKLACQYHPHMFAGANWES